MRDSAGADADQRSPELWAGDFNDPDHWKDLQGYPRLVETRLETK